MQPVEQPKTPSFAKYDIIYTLALQGFKPKDIVELTLSNLHIPEDSQSYLININHRTAELTLEQTLSLAGYIDNNRSRIMESNGYVFPSVPKNGSPSGQWNTDAIRMGVREHIKRHYGKSMDDIGWQASLRKPMSTGIRTIEDVRKLMEELKKNPGN